MSGYKRPREGYVREPAYKKRRVGYTSTRKRRSSKKMTIPRSKKEKPNNVRYAGYAGLEKKYFDSEHDHTLLVNDLQIIPSTTANNLNPIQTGSGATNRDGRQVINKNLFINYSCSNLSSNGHNIRLLVVADLQCNKQVIDPDAVLTGANKMLAFRDLSNIKRFKVYKDIIVNIPPQSLPVWNTNTNAIVFSTASNTVNGSIAIDLKDIQTNFNASTGNIGDINDVAFYLLAATDAGTPNLMAVKARARLRFYG